MTYLAVSTNTGDGSSLFGAEGARMAELQAEGVVEHLWLKADWSGAALVLTGTDEGQARAALESLPITRAGLTTWALTELVVPPPPQ